jgi:DNA invertase Pin-like site-specific DNA recombinase
MPDSGQVFAYTYHDPLFESIDESNFEGFISNIMVTRRKIDRVYQDRGTRQQLHQLLQDCRTESVAYLLVRRLEELGDSVAEVCTCLAELDFLNISLITTEDVFEATADSDDSESASTTDTDLAGGHGSSQAETLAEPSFPNPKSKIQNPKWYELAAPNRPSELLRRLQLVQAHHHSQQLRRGHARNRVKALPPPGRAPYGYRRGKDRYLLDRSTAPVVKDFFDHFLLYGSLRGSVRYLQKKYGKKLSVSTGKRWLTSPVYRGDLLYHTGEIVPDTHMPILPREEAAQVDRLLRRNRQMPPRTASAPRSLSGLVVCGTCQSAMKVSRVVARRQQAGQKEYLYLTPVACSRQPTCRALPYPQVLEQTIQQICQGLPPAVNEAALPPVEDMKQSLNAQISAKQAVLEQLPPLVATGVLDAETADLRAYKIRTEVAALQLKLAQLPPVNLKAIAQVASLPQFWLDLSEAERRFYFREFIRQIQILRNGEDWQIQLVFIF